MQFNIFFDGTCNWIRVRIVKYFFGLFCKSSLVFSVVLFVWTMQYINSLFLMPLMNFFFYMLPRFHQNLSHHLIIKKYPPCWSFKLIESNKFKVDITSRTGLSWNADMWLTNLPQTACVTLSLFQMSNQIVKFNSWKLIAARWIWVNTVLMQSQCTLSIQFRTSIRRWNRTWSSS